MKTHLAKTESLTVVIDDKEITVTAQQLLGLKQAETTDLDEKYRELIDEMQPLWWNTSEGDVQKLGYYDGSNVPTQLSAQRVRTYIKLLNIAAKLNGEADWNGDGEMLYAFDGVIRVGQIIEDHIGISVRFKHGLALEALTYLNSEDKIAMFGCDKVKED
jgi:hypothetical protein